MGAGGESPCCADHLEEQLLPLEILRSRRGRVVIGAAVLTGLFFLVRYDTSSRSPVESCVYGAALVATGTSIDEGKDVAMEVYPHYGDPDTDGHELFFEVQEPYWSDVMCFFRSTIGD